MEKIKAYRSVRTGADLRTRGVFWRNVKKYRALLLMALPCVIVLVLNAYLPLFGLTIAFKNFNYQDRFASPWVGLENFKFLFATDAAWRITRNTIGYNMAFIFLGLVANVAVAIGLNEIKNRRAKKLYQTAVVLPNFLSMVVIAYVVYALLSTKGFVNAGVLERLGAAPVAWYSEPRYWPYILIFTKLWNSVGYGSVIYIAALTGIDAQLYEAACIDGASKWQQTRYITIPSLTTMMTISVILQLGSIIRGDFGLFLQIPMESPQLYPVTDVVDTYVYRALISMNDIGMSSAASFYQSMVGFVMVILANLVVRRIDKNQAIF
jgi:putative aldouronate transport system permease protein